MYLRINYILSIYLYQYINFSTFLQKSSRNIIAVLLKGDWNEIITELEEITQFNWSIILVRHKPTKIFN